MKFDWRNFTEADYNSYIAKRMEDIFDCHDYIGAIYVGDICIELIDCGEEDILMYNFYVAHEDTGYGYKDEAFPYDYADGSAMDIPHGLSYEEFKNKAEQLFMDYIKSYNGNYSLVEHANKQLEIW